MVLSSNNVRLEQETHCS